MSAKLNWPLNSSSIEHLDCERHHVSISLLYWQKKQHILASLRKAEQNIFVPSGLATGVFEELPQTRLHQERQASLVERCQAGSGSGRSLGLPGTVRLGRKRGETSFGFSPRGDPQEIRNRLVIQPTGPRFWV